MGARNGIIYSGHSSAPAIIIASGGRRRSIDHARIARHLRFCDWTPGNRPLYRQNDGAVADFIPPSFRKQTLGSECREIFAYCHKRRISVKLNSSIIVTPSNWILVHFRVIVIVERVHIITCTRCSFRRKIPVIINFWRKAKEFPSRKLCFKSSRLCA